MCHIIILVNLLLSFLSGVTSIQSMNINTVDSDISSHEEVQYNCNFENLWTKERHPNEYPLGNIAHWMDQIMISHNDSYSMWNEGVLASTAVEKMLLSGDPAPLIEEVVYSNYGSYEIGDAKNIVSDPIVTFNHPVSLTSNNHYLSVIAKMAPSPDWFTGFHDFDAINEKTSTWYESFNIETYPCDAGIDDGDTYYTAHRPSNPAQPIIKFTIDNVPNGVYLNQNGTKILPVARYSCSMADRNEKEEFEDDNGIKTVDSQVSSSQNVEYQCTFKNQWNVSNYPDLLPMNRTSLSLHWTRQIVAAHDRDYMMWEEGSFASNAVEKLAELGGIGDIITELREHDYSFTIGYDKYLDDAHPLQTFDTLPMTANRSFISAIAKLAPSPDWFLGFHNFHAVNERTETWYHKFAIPVFLYDAGTEDGETFETINNATYPVQPILRFYSSKGGRASSTEENSTAVPSVASFTCTLYNLEDVGIPNATLSTLSPIQAPLTILPTRDPALESGNNWRIIVGIFLVSAGALLVAGVLICMILCKKAKYKSGILGREDRKLLKKAISERTIKTLTSSELLHHQGNKPRRISSPDMCFDDIPLQIIEEEEGKEQEVNSEGVPKTELRSSTSLIQQFWELFSLDSYSSGRKEQKRRRKSLENLLADDTNDKNKRQRPRESQVEEILKQFSELCPSSEFSPSNNVSKNGIDHATKRKSAASLPEDEQFDKTMTEEPSSDDIDEEGIEQSQLQQALKYMEKLHLEKVPSSVIVKKKKKKGKDRQD